MSEDKRYKLPEIPHEKDFEDYVSAYAQLGGQFLERGIVFRVDGENGVDELLELDIVGTKLSKEEREMTIMEIKSGNWGFKDVFKVAGWMQLLKIDNGIFVIQDDNQYMDVEKSYAAKLSIDLISDKKLDGVNLMSRFSIDPNNIWRKPALLSLRYAYAVEKGMLTTLLSQKKSMTNKDGYGLLWNYIFEMTNGSFFESNPVTRDQRLFNLFVKNKNFTARFSHEEPTKGFPNEAESIERNKFIAVFNGLPAKDVLHVSLYAELLNRLLVLKSTVEYAILGQRQGENPYEQFLASLEERGLSNNILDAVEKFKREQYFYLYPYFWQIFIYLFGGFILIDKEQEERQLLSDITKIPLTELDNAFVAFDKLFPLGHGSNWIEQINETSHIKILKLFPRPLSGVGVNFRRWLYATDEQKTMANLFNQLQGTHTADDLARWNGNTCAYLDKYEIKDNSL